MSLKEFKRTDLACVYCSTRDVYEDTTCTANNRHFYCATCGRAFRNASVTMDADKTVRMAVLLAELQHRPEPKVCAKCIYFHKQSGLWIETKLTGRHEAGVCNKHERITSPTYTCPHFMAH